MIFLTEDYFNICKNENNVKWIPFYIKKIWYLIEVFSTSLFKEKYSIARSFNHKNLSSLNIHSMSGLEKLGFLVQERLCS